MKSNIDASSNLKLHKNSASDAAAVEIIYGTMPFKPVRVFEGLSDKFRADMDAVRPKSGAPLTATAKETAHADTDAPFVSQGEYIPAPAATPETEEGIVASAPDNRLLIAGGAGTGKTTLLERRVTALRGVPVKILNPLAPIEDMQINFTHLVVDDATLFTRENQKKLLALLSRLLKSNGVGCTITADPVLDAPFFGALLNMLKSDTNLIRYELGTCRRAKSRLASSVLPKVRAGLAEESGNPLYARRIDAAFEKYAFGKSLEEILLTPARLLPPAEESTALICLNPCEAVEISTALRHKNIEHDFLSGSTALSPAPPAIGRLSGRPGVLTVATTGTFAEFDNVYMLGTAAQYGFREVYRALSKMRMSFRVIYRSTRPDFVLDGDRPVLLSHLTKSDKTVCGGIFAGLDGDVDEIGGSTSESAGEAESAESTAATREYIRRHVKRGDKVCIRRGYGDTYLIYHDDRLIGSMSKTFSQSVVRAVSLGESGKVLPSGISGLFVDEIFSPDSTDRNEKISLKIFGLGKCEHKYYE